MYERERVLNGIEKCAKARTVVINLFIIQENKSLWQTGKQEGLISRPD